MSSVSETKKSYNAFKKKWQKLEEKAKEEGEESEHLADMGSNPGMYNRGGDYAKYGYHYIKQKQDRRKTYDSTDAKLKKALQSRFTRAQGTTVGSPDHIKRYKYDYKKRNSAGTQYNFHNQNMPYQSQAHHIIPDEVFSTNEGRFTDDEMLLLKKVPYNINHGENIIFLPTDEGNCIIHNIPKHNGSHPQYNNKVSGDVVSIKSKLTEKKSNPCTTEDLPVIEILSDLIRYQKTYWDWLVDQGAGNINELSRPSDDDV